MADYSDKIEELADNSIDIVEKTKIVTEKIKLWILNNNTSGKTEDFAFVLDFFIGKLEKIDRKLETILDLLQEIETETM